MDVRRPRSMSRYSDTSALGATTGYIEHLTTILKTTAEISDVIFF